MKELSFIILCLLLTISTSATEKKRFTKSFFVPANKPIELSSEVGLDVKMQSWSKDSVYIDLYVKVKSSDKKYEKTYIEEFNIDVWENSSSVEITIEDTDEKITTSFWDIITFNFAKSVEIDIEGIIRVPNQNALSADIQYSEIKLKDMDELLIIDGRGNELTLENCNKLEKISNEYGDINLLDTAGDNLKVNSRSSKINVENHSGSIIIDSPYTNISVIDVKGSLIVDSRSSEIEVSGITGELKIEADYSNITIENINEKSHILTRSSNTKAKNVDLIKFVGPYSNLYINEMKNNYSNVDGLIENRSGKIQLSNIESSLKIIDAYSEIDLRDITGDVHLVSRSNDISCSGLFGNWSSKTDYCNINLIDFRSKEVRIKNKSGKVDLEFDNTPSDVIVENEYSDVYVYVPANYQGSYDLECKYGNIITDFEHRKIKGETISILEGMIGESSNTMNVKLKSGNIYFRKND